MSPNIRIHLPTPLRAHAGQQAIIEIEADTVGNALRELARRHPGLERHLYDGDGALRRYVNVYRNQEDIRGLGREAASLSAGDTLSIVPSIAGGSEPSKPGARAANPGRPKLPPPDWQTGADGLPALSQDELFRYSRHLILPDVGLQGQRRLKAASVLCVGAGGLGSPLSLYLAAAGVGRIGLVDDDRVDASNLQRQILYGTSQVGVPKLEAARARLADLNPEVRVEVHPTRLTSANAMELLAPYDVVVDGTDNFPTRYLVNDACTLLGKPNVYGSIFRFEGQASVFDARKGPCYRCLYPDPPPPGLVPSCAEGGVLGVLPGVIGVIQAIETLKQILGAGESLVGRLLLFDALALRFRELTLRKDPDCPLCGRQPTITALVDYEAFCGLDTVPRADGWEIAATELRDRLARGDDLLLVDVREPDEFAIARIEGATLIPLNTIPERMHEFDSGREIVLHCHKGVRSLRALELLRQSGFQKLKSLRGGIEAWSQDVDPGVPRY